MDELQWLLAALHGGDETHDGTASGRAPQPLPDTGYYPRHPVQDDGFSVTLPDLGLFPRRVIPDFGFEQTGPDIGLFPRRSRSNDGLLRTLPDLRPDPWRVSPSAPGLRTLPYFPPDPGHPAPGAKDMHQEPSDLERPRRPVTRYFPFVGPLEAIMWGEQGYADQFDPRRRIPGSGMPPTAAPQFGNQMSRGTPFAGAPALVPARSASNNIIDPQVMKMMMEMLSRRNQQQAPAAVGISPTVVQAAPSPVQSQAMDGFWAKGSPAPQGGGWLGMLGGLFGQGGGGADVFPRGLDVGV